MLPSTLTTDFNLDEIIDMLAYLDARQGLDNTALADALELLTEGSGKWEIKPLVEQIQERSAVIAPTL